MKFRNKPVVIKSIQWTGDNLDEIKLFVGDTWWDCVLPNRLSIDTTEGWINVPKGWWIIKGVEGEFYTCEPSIFRKTYEKIGE